MAFQDPIQTVAFIYIQEKQHFIHPVTKKEVIIVAPPPIDKIWDQVS